MKFFGRKSGIYANDSSSHKPVGLFVCSECGATVTEANKETHVEWHTNIETRITALEGRPSWVYTYPQVSTGTQFQKYDYPIIWNNSSTTTSTGNILGQITTTNYTANIDWPPKDEGEGDCSCDVPCE